MGAEVAEIRGCEGGVCQRKYLVAPSDEKLHGTVSYPIPLSLRVWPASAPVRFPRAVAGRTHAVCDLCCGDARARVVGGAGFSFKLGGVTRR